MNRVDSISRGMSDTKASLSNSTSANAWLAANLLAWPALNRKPYRLDPSFAT
jgi:hypothetical protein